MTAAWSVDRLQTLFKEKLQEKYKLNIRDLKRAFGKYDTDNNGLLDLEEITGAIKGFLNGVPDTAVAGFIAMYDTNGDGKISYEEFLAILMSKESLSKLAGRGSPRSARSSPRIDDELPNPPRPSAPIPPAQNKASRPVPNLHAIPPAPPSIYSAAEDSNLDITNPNALETRAQSFLNGLKAQLLQQAGRVRQQGKAGPLQERLIVSSSQLLEGIAREALSKSFQPYTGEGDGRVRSKSGAASGVEIADFSRVLRSLAVPGCPPLRPEVIHFLFSLCEPMSTASYNPTKLSNSASKVADPAILAHLMFGNRSNPLTRSSAAAPIQGHDTIDPSSAPGQQLGRNHGRQALASGPMRALSLKDQAPPTVALKFISPKARTSLVAPSTLDPSLVKRSSQAPCYDLVCHHVFGMSSTLRSGSTLFSVPSVVERPTQVAAAGSRAGGDKRPSRPTDDQSSRRKSDFIDSACIVYPTAALGVTHDLSTNTQTFFTGHTDDITCMAVSKDGQLAATGQAGKQSFICVWSTMPLPPGESVRSVIVTVGEGFFDRAVCSVNFTCDNQYVVGISCDDAHRIGVFCIKSGVLQAEAGCQHGLPPQIRQLQCCPSKQYTEYITKNHQGLCDVFATVGEHHIKLWSFRRADPGSLTNSIEPSDPSLEYKTLTLGTQSSGPGGIPKVYTCCEFLPTGTIGGTVPPSSSAAASADKVHACDLLAGGSNGTVYAYRRGVCYQSTPVIRGGISALVLAGEHIVCGGAGGVIKVLDCRTLCILTAVHTGSAAASRLTTPKGRPSAPATSSDSTSGITGLAAIMGPKGRVAYVIASTRNGRAIKVDLANVGQSSAAGSAGSETTTLFSYHTGEVWGLTAGSTTGSKHRFGNRVLMATCGDDRLLAVWDAASRTQMASITTIAAARCVHFDRTCSFLAIGTQTGSVHIYTLISTPTAAPAAPKGEAMSSHGRSLGEARQLASSQQAQRSGKGWSLLELVYRKDCKEGISDIKFSPLDDKVAAGSNDDTIVIYSCVAGTSTGAAGMTPTATLTPLHRLRGHSSFITHLDWTADGQLLRSTCGAHELLFWDASTGRQYTLPTADCRWRTNTCPIGFSVMGIWPPYADGTDVNAVDGQNDLGLVVTGDDFGNTKLFNYPCVVKDAPCKTGRGHASHVTNARFLSSAMQSGSTAAITTTGGMDSTVVLWGVIPVTEGGPRRREYAVGL